MTTTKRILVAVRLGSAPAVLAVLFGLVFPGVGVADEPAVPLATPWYTFDPMSPTVQDGSVLPDAVLMLEMDEVPGVRFDGFGLGLGQPGDHIDALSGPNSTVDLDTSFVVLFSVDRATVGEAAPDPNLVAAGVPYNATNQAALNQAAGDQYLGLMLYTRNGMFTGRSDGQGRGTGNNTLALNNFDEGGRDFGALPPTSAEDQGIGPQDEVSATAQTPSARGSAVLYYSLNVESPSLLDLPGDSGADIFIDPEPGVRGTEQLFVDQSQLNLEVGDEINAIIVFDSDVTDGPFGPGDQVLFSLAPGSPSLGVRLPGESPGDVFSVVHGPVEPGAPTLFASAGELGLNVGGGPVDNLDALEFEFCPDAVACAIDHGIRAPAAIPTASGWGLAALALVVAVGGAVVVARRAAGRLNAG